MNSPVRVSNSFCLINAIFCLGTVLVEVMFSIASKKGSISAEHGLGVMKPHMIYYSKQPLLVELMKSIKKIFDPNGILNPYKVLPQ
jgi:FAD/FMN-containing dehydrogenase